MLYACTVAHSLVLLTKVDVSLTRKVAAFSENESLGMVVVCDAISIDASSVLV